jgi:hypothetical protein
VHAEPSIGVHPATTGPLAAPARESQFDRIKLGDCSQAHVELWLAGPPSRVDDGDVIRWACRRRWTSPLRLAPAFLADILGMHVPTAV